MRARRVQLQSAWLLVFLVFLIIVMQFNSASNPAIIMTSVLGIFFFGLDAAFSAIVKQLLALLG